MQAIGVLKMMNPAPLSPPYRTYVLDDHKFITEILTLQLNSDSHIDVVGIGNRGTAGIHFVKNHRVDIALVDMELDGDDGVHVAREMLEADPRIRVVGLSAHVANHYALALLEAGGRGYISKKSSTKEIVEGVKRVARGDLAISPDVAYHLATEVKESGPVSKVRGLTEKEQVILRLTGLGLSAKEAAEEMGVSVKTIQGHRINIRRKLNIATDVGLCLLALKAGIVGLKDTG